MIDHEDDTYLVHYIGWNKSHDEIVHADLMRVTKPDTNENECDPTGVTSASPKKSKSKKSKRTSKQTTKQTPKTNDSSSRSSSRLSKRIKQEALLPVLEMTDPDASLVLLENSKPNEKQMRKPKSITIKVGKEQPSVKLEPGIVPEGSQKSLTLAILPPPVQSSPSPTEVVPKNEPKPPSDDMYLPHINWIEPARDLQEAVANYNLRPTTSKSVMRRFGDDVNKAIRRIATKYTRDLPEYSNKKSRFIVKQEVISEDEEHEVIDFREFFGEGSSF